MARRRRTHTVVSEDQLDRARTLEVGKSPTEVTREPLSSRARVPPRRVGVRGDLRVLFVDTGALYLRWR